MILVPVVASGCHREHLHSLVGTKGLGSSGAYSDFVVEALHAPLEICALARNQFSIRGSWALLYLYAAFTNSSDRNQALFSQPLQLAEPEPFPPALAPSGPAAAWLASGGAPTQSRRRQCQCP